MALPRDMLQHLKSSLAGDVRLEEPMFRHTTYRVGGPAAAYVVCDTLSDLSRTIDVVVSEEIPYAVLGRGSNVLVSDAGYDGVVVVLGREFRRHRFEDDRIEAGAGCVLGTLVQDAFAKGLSGLEFAVGIPGTLGGALVMNAGTRDEWIGSRVESVTLHVPGSGLARLRGSEVGWGYRRSGLGVQGVVVEAVIAAKRGDREAIQRVMEANFRRRKRTQPVGAPSAGSVFVNPANVSAGRLIESAGLKGASVGGARVSDVHANFIVNAGSAHARDIVELMRLMREAVEEKYGIQLTPEIRFLGEFERSEEGAAGSGADAEGTEPAEHSSEA